MAQCVSWRIKLPHNTIDPLGQMERDWLMLNLVGHYIATGLALLDVTDPFPVLGLVRPLWCAIVVHVVAVGGNDRKVRSQRSVSITKACRFQPESISFHPIQHDLVHVLFLMGYNCVWSVVKILQALPIPLSKRLPDARMQSHSLVSDCMSLAKGRICFDNTPLKMPTALLETSPAGVLSIIYCFSLGVNCRSFAEDNTSSCSDRLTIDPCFFSLSPSLLWLIFCEGFISLAKPSFERLFSLFNSFSYTFPQCWQ